VPYRWEGWGLTRDRARLVASDGSARLRWLRPPDLRVTRSVVVRDGATPVVRLNELEMLSGRIWANIWLEDRVAIIAPGDGRVRAWLDLSALRSGVAQGAGVLNGIARDPITGHVIVTGKNWDRMFVIRPTTSIP
jgi:glutamine cyclotransferase